MITTTETVTFKRFASEILHGIQTDNERLTEVIEWADKNPIVWKIITETRSKAFGRNSCFYFGCDQKSMESGAILSRAAHLKNELERPRVYDGRQAPIDDFHLWKVKFTLEHYKDKGFRGGFFQQIDPQNYSRGCSYIDYTPATLSEVIDRFRAWCDVGYKFETREIQIDKKVVWTP
jgi:hypothetical protein